MAKKFSLPRGTADLIFPDILKWQHMESVAREIFNLFAYKEIRTPYFEETELFARSMGQTSEVVQKQMLSLASNKEETQTQSLSYTLRPEGTASIVRAYNQHNLDKKESLSKLFYMGAMFRGERPQKGRLRQFHQIGAEVIGPESTSAFIDAEMIALAMRLLSDLKVDNVELKINTLGSKEDKNRFAQWLKVQLSDQINNLSPALQESFHQNVFRILDSKDQACRKMVASLNLDHSYLSEESREYFSQVLTELKNLGIRYTVTPQLVRGLDYYTHTVFEISCHRLGSQDAVGAGGRYNSLIQELGGSKGIDGIGFALGMERILLAQQNCEEPSDTLAQLDVFFIALDDQAFQQVFKLADELRQKKISCDLNYRMGSVKSQMRAANKSKAQFTAIIGPEEMKKNIVNLKDMTRGDQQEIPWVGLAEAIKDKRKG